MQSEAAIAGTLESAAHSAAVPSRTRDRSTSAAPRLWWATRDFAALEWLFAAVVLQTILFNPVLGSAGPLAVYFSAVTWPLLFGAAIVRAVQSKDVLLKRALTGVFVSTALVAGLIAVQLGVEDLQVYSLSTLPKLAYIPAGVVAALCVYRAADRLLDLIVLALGVKCTLLVFEALQGPVDLLHRLNPRSLGGANTFGTFLGLLVVLRLSTWVLRGRRPGPLVFLALIPCLVALSLTFTRSAFIAFVVGMTALVVLAAGRRGVRAGLVAGFSGLAGSGILLSQGAVRERLASFASSGRDDILQAAWTGFTERPAAGHGLGSFQFSSPYVVEFSGAGTHTTPSAHNLFLQVAYEGGCLGLIAVGWALWNVLRRCWSSVLVPVLLMLGVSAMFENFPYVIQTSWVIGVLLAVGLHHRVAAAKASSTEPRP